MDDTRIRELAEEVLRELRSPSAEGGSRPDLEARVAALETEVARLRRQLKVAPAEAQPAVHLHLEAPHGPEHPLRGHPSHLSLGPGIREGRCVVEPDKPCVHSGQCRSFGF